MTLPKPPMLQCSRNPRHRQRMRRAWSLEGVPTRVLALPTGWVVEGQRAVCPACASWARKAIEAASR